MGLIYYRWKVQFIECDAPLAVRELFAFLLFSSSPFPPFPPSSLKLPSTLKTSLSTRTFS